MPTGRFGDEPQFQSLLSMSDLLRAAGEPGFGPRLPVATTAPVPPPRLEIPRLSPGLDFLSRALGIAGVTAASINNPQFAHLLQANLEQQRRQRRRHGFSVGLAQVQRLAATDPRGALDLAQQLASIAEDEVELGVSTRVYEELRKRIETTEQREQERLITERIFGGPGVPQMTGAAPKPDTSRHRAERDRLTRILSMPGITANQAAALKVLIGGLDREIERHEGLSPTQFEQQLQLSQERGAAAFAQQPLPAETAKQVGELETLISEVERIEQLYKPEFVGPLTGRLAGVVESITGDLPAEQIEMRAALRDAQDALLRARSGAQINEQEFKRLMSFLPNDNLPPKAFEVRLKRFKEVLGTMLREKRKAAGLTRGDVQQQAPVPGTVRPQPGGAVQGRGEKGDPLGGF